MAETIGFEYFSGHLISIPVLLGHRPLKFLLDTGIGLTMISKEIADKYGIISNESFRGKRMSGQEISVPLGTISKISIGSLVKEDIVCGIFDMSGFPPEFRDIHGIISMKFFEDTAFTMNYSDRSISLGLEDSPPKSSPPNISVPITLEKDGPSITIFTKLKLPDGTIGKVEVDSGSSALILDASLMAKLGVHEDGEGVQIVKGTDETGHEYARHFTRLKGTISLAEAQEITQTDPEVIFQDIIYDGLIGDQFLRRYRVTYDLEKSVMYFS